MLKEKIENIIVTLSLPLNSEEILDGWTDDSKRAILEFFKNLLHDVIEGRHIPYVALVRGLDAWGIEGGGDLYKKAMEIAQEINQESN